MLLKRWSGQKLVAGNSACWQTGLAPRTMRRIKASIPAVTEKFAAYRTEQLADLWAKTLLDDAGVDVPETTEPL